MWSKTDVFEYAMVIFRGKDFDICVIDFLLLCSNVTFAMRKKHRDFRDELVRRFGVYSQDSPNKQHHCCKWTVEIIYSEIIDDVIAFNENLKSEPESHGLIFICLDNEVSPDQQALLNRSYVDSTFFQLDVTCPNITYEKIFNFLQGKKTKNVVKNKLVNFYPLLLHVDSISSGLVFNYYYSYLNRQIGSTNNIFLTFTFEKNINPESFPPTISVILNTLIENNFLEECPSTIESDHPISIQSNLLIFTLDSTTYRSFDGFQTVVTFSLNGVNDFGSIVQQILIWQDKLDLNALTSIQLKDDIRGWIEEYRPCSSINRENEQVNMTFENRDDLTKKCRFFPRIDVPDRNNGHNGVSTMKKTTKDCYDLYISDPKNGFTEDGRKISKTLMIPVYYIIMPSSCQFGPSDINETSQCDEIILKGTIIDPNIPTRIRLAYAHREVLRSPPMIHYNRYLRRTFYYVDEINNNNEIIRYLFCGEYPNILSILDQLEKNGEISKIEKHDEYLRFCNMLHRLVQFNNLSQSIKLIQINDQSNEIDCIDADFKPLWDQIKEDIDQWYQTSDNRIVFPTIESKIIDLAPTHHILLFFTDKAREDPLIVTLISDLKEKLEINEYFIEDANGNLNLIETKKQIIFICTGRKNDQINRSIINAVQQKINKFGVLRDVFILINDAIRHFPCRFIRSIPYLTFDLHKRSAYLNSEEIQQIIYYLNNMNVLSACYTDSFQDINYFLNKSPLQCTSIGEGCAAAFYFNYAKLLTSLSDHQYRIELINKQLEKEKLIDQKSRFIAKWIFVLPSTIENTKQLLSSGLTINENEQKIIGFQLTIWKSTDPNFINPNLSVTIGGVFQRSYSPLVIYKLTNLTTKESFYFPMEIPAALHGLQNQYEDLLSHFNFGHFDPLKQGLVFQKKIQQFLSNDQDKTCHENLIFVPVDNSYTSISNDSSRNFQQAQILLETLWNNLSLSIQDQ